MIESHVNIEKLQGSLIVDGKPMSSKIINLNLGNKTLTMNPLEINLNSKLNDVVESYIAETGIKREDIQLSELARWMENKD